MTNFISDDGWTLQELRSVRSVWLQTLHALICAGGTPTKPQIELKVSTLTRNMSVCVCVCVYESARLKLLMMYQCCVFVVGG
jgi:hypothetical protein